VEKLSVRLCWSRREEGGHFPVGLSSPLRLVGASPRGSLLQELEGFEVELGVSFDDRD
jgi:hypothetical protein